MDAVEFIKERSRMCDSFQVCSNCPACSMSCTNLCTMSTDDVTALVSVVEKWSREYPCKTRQSEFLKQWPSAKIDKSIDVLNICPADLDERYRDARGRCKIMSTRTGTCDCCRREFWMQEVE